MAEERKIDETNTKVFEKTLFAVIPALPLKVLGADNKVLGSATLEWCEGGAYLKFFLDPHHPESFNLSVEPNRVKVHLYGQVFDDHFRGYIVLE